MDDKLTRLGLTPYELSAPQREGLDGSGFTILPSVIDSTWLDGLRSAFDEIYAREGDAAGEEVAQMEGVRRLADLANKGEVFDRVYLQPALLAAVWHVLQRPFKLHSLNGHDPLPGHGQQELHADWGGSRGPGEYHVVNSMWLLDDMAPDNGAMRLVPGSHLLPERPQDHMEDRLAVHQDEVYLTGVAGTVGVFNGTAWHSCTQNRSGASRRVLHCAYIAREHEQQTDQRAHLMPETAARLSPLARYVLDV